MDHSEYRIFGPPGTGKTTRLAHEIGRAARQFGSENVVAVSFTRAAAHEIGSRNVPLPRDRVGTLHSFAWRALGRPIIAETKADEWNSSGIPSGWMIQKQSGALDDHAALNGDRGGWQLNQWNLLRSMQRERDIGGGDLKKFVEAWTDWKAGREYFDFTDLIACSLIAIDSCPGAPLVGFFDESQDFTPLELALVRKWGARMKFFILAGDDDQCIYSFKGATPHAFLTPPVDDDHKIFLSQSYRVPRAVHREALQYTDKLAEREAKEYRPRDEEGAVDRSSLSIHAGDVEALVSAVHDATTDGSTAMILTSCGYMLGGRASITNDGRQGFGVIDAMRNKGMPFWNPYRSTRGDWNPMRGATRRLAAYLRPCPMTWGDDERRSWSWHDLWDWIEHIPSSGSDAKLVRGAKKKVREMAKDERADDVVPVAIVNDLFLDGVQWWNGSPDLLADLWAPKKRSSLRYPMRIIKRQGRAALVQKPRVIVGTIHSVKGGEADTVFLAPDLSASGFEEWRGETKRDRVRRLFYVATTRARRRLVLLSASDEQSVW